MYTKLFTILMSSALFVSCSSEMDERSIASENTESNAIALQNDVETETESISRTIRHYESTEIEATVSTTGHSSYVHIPKGALEVDTTVTLEQSMELINDNTVSALVANNGLQLQGGQSIIAAPAVLLSTSGTSNATKDMTMSLPLPVTKELGLFGDPFEKLAVVAKVIDFDSNKVVARVLPRENVSLTGDGVTIQTKRFGAYQAVLLNNDLQSIRERVAADISVVEEESGNNQPTSLLDESQLVAQLENEGKNATANEQVLETIKDQLSKIKKRINKKDRFQSLKPEIAQRIQTEAPKPIPVREEKETESLPSESDIAEELDSSTYDDDEIIDENNGNYQDDERITEIREDIKALNLKIEKKKAHKKLLSEKLSNLKTKLKEARKASKAALIAKKEKLKEKLAHLKIQRKDLKSEIQELRKSKDLTEKQKRMLNKLEVLLDKTKEKLKASNERKKALNAKLRNVQKVKDNKRLQSLLVKLNNCKDKLASLRLEKKTLKDELKALRSAN